MAEASRSRRRPPTTESRRVFVAKDDALAQVEPWTGRPLWIDHVPGARWANCHTVIRIGNRIVCGARRRAPSLLPRLLVYENGSFHEPSAAEHHGYGRPRRIEAKRALVLYAAWARDVAGDTQREVAENLYGGRTVHITEREIKRVRDAERDGRTLYRDLGILPWAAYADARPAKRWWTDPAFETAIRDWQLQAVVEPSDEPAPDPAQAQQETWEQMRETLGKRIGFAKITQRITGSLRGALGGLRIEIDGDALRAAALRAGGIEPWRFPEDEPSDD